MRVLMLTWQVLAVVGVPSKMSACMEIDHVRLRALHSRMLAYARVLLLRKRWGSEGSGLCLVFVCSVPRALPLPLTGMALLKALTADWPPASCLLRASLSFPCPSLPFSAPCLSALLTQIKELESTGYNAVVMLAAARCVGSGGAGSVLFLADCSAGLNRALARLAPDKDRAVDSPFCW